MLKNNIIAYFELSLSMIFLGSTLVIAKSLLLVFPIFILLFLRFFIGTIFFGGFVACYYIKTPNIFHYRLVNKKDICSLFGQAFFGAFLFNFFMLSGLKQTTANSAAVITSTIPAFISLFSYFFLKEIISRNKLLAIAISMLGLIFLNFHFSYNNNNSSTMGNMLIVLAIISGAMFPILVKSVSKHVSPVIASFAFNLFGLLLFFPFALSVSFDYKLITINFWFLAIIYSFFANVLYLIFWNRGLARISASTASLFTAIMPVSTSILSYIFLGDTINLQQAIGMLCVISAVFIGVSKEKST